MNNFDKKNWQKIKFGDIAKEVRITEHDPLKNGLKHYVGLEHIESEDLHIKSWGDISDGTTFTRKFVKGQVLFGRRRAYLKKAALASFDGICSGDILVFEADNDKLLPELLPFIVQNDNFFQYAVDASAGSLSPRVKFKDLAKFELMLPKSLDEQKKLADLLWAGDELVQKYTSLRGKLNVFYESNVQTLNRGSFSSKLKTRKLGEVLNINPENISSKTDGKTEIIYIDISSISYKDILKNEIKKFYFKDAPSRAKRIVKEDDVIVSLVRPYQQQIVIAKDIKKNTLSSTGTAILRSKDKLLLSLIYHQLFSKNFIYFCERIMTGTNYPAITADDLASFKVFFYDNPKENKNLLDKLSAIENEIIALSKNITVTKKINDLVKNEIFS